ncbi:ParB/RepB/Spo0J family partition protein [Adlercreutzia sp. ZJ141]|uniref:ParB/RepB/Spo0J family partition protein n=1 Tax=Adlercreutzia sp. ZJ141 TaxID=2709406 RepID=UPI0013EBA2D1|nr:ParB N-terminal domain-containing protein [Adlercreutzia sp. ZJ141]
MRSAKELARSFTLSGVIDEMTETRNRYPVEQIPAKEIEEHPGNAVYSMDERAIVQLAASIKRDGLTDLPLVRRLDDGTFQMLSGHRRRAAYLLLAEEDDAFSRMPCRVVEGVDDDQALVILHSANFFTRELTVTERAQATRALDGRVEQLREEDPGLSGMRTEDIKAKIISEQTGRQVSGRTIRRTEDTAKAIETQLSLGWRRAAEGGLLSDEAIAMLAGLPERQQQALHVKWSQKKLGKRATTCFIKQEAGPEEADPRLKAADAAIVRFLRNKPDTLRGCDREMLDALGRHIQQLEESY